MATRRIVETEKTYLDTDNDAPQEKSDITPVVPKDIVYKLLGFTLAMVVIPIGSYFFAVNTFLAGHNSYAAGLAAVLANVVLISYIVVAMNEDDPDKKPETKKNK